MKNILFLLYLLAFGGGMYALGTRAERRHPGAASIPAALPVRADPKLQTPTLETLLTKLRTLPTTPATAGDWTAETTHWQQAESGLRTWCAANPTHPHQHLAGTARANCAAALDALQSGDPASSSAAKMCRRILQQALLRNASLLALLSTPAHAPDPSAPHTVAIPAPAPTLATF